MDFPKDLFLKLIYYLVCPLLLLSYLLEPFTADVRIYLAAAKVTALTPGFPMTLDTVWESRFIGHRFLYYVLNMIDPFDGWLYSIWMKFIVAVVTIAILYYFSKQVSDKMQISFHYPFVLGYLGLFAINNFIIFSAEYFTVVFAMLMLALLLDDRRWCWVLSGLLILPLIILKGLTVLLVPIVVLAVILLIPDYKIRFHSALLSLPVVALSGLALFLYFPHFISDIVLMTKVAHLAKLDLWQVSIYFVKYGLGVIGFAPLIIIALFVSFILLSIVTKVHLRDVGLLLAMWLVAAVYTLIISEFFYYHNYLMLIPALLTICYLLKIYEHHRAAFVSIVVLVLVIYAGIVSGWSVGLASNGYQHWYNHEQVADDILDRYDLLEQPTTLYLDIGYAAYYFPTRSECRYVSALPYQRDMPDWSMKDTSEYWEMKYCALNYTGRYIIVDPVWFNLKVDTHREMADKLDTEYTRVYDSNYWDIYQRKVTD